MKVCINVVLYIHYNLFIHTLKYFYILFKFVHLHQPFTLHLFHLLSFSFSHFLPSINIIHAHPHSLTIISLYLSHHPSLLFIYLTHPPLPSLSLISIHITHSHSNSHPPFRPFFFFLPLSHCFSPSHSPSLS